MNEEQILRQRLRELDKRSVEIEASLRHELPGPKQQALQAEQEELASVRRVTDFKLH